MLDQEFMRQYASDVSRRNLFLHISLLTIHDASKRIELKKISSPRLTLAFSLHMNDE